jgi:predicted transcriptional regulator
MSDILRVNVESLASSLERAAKVMEALEQGKKVKQQEGIGFANVASMLSLFTPKRWELIEVLRSSEAMSVKALSTILNRNYKNVHTDVAALIEWGVLKRNESNLVYVPYNELVFDVKLPVKKAA